MTKNREILFMDPVCTHNIWGGERLWEEFHYLVPDRHSGECWGISAAYGRENIVRNGTFRGMKLSDLWQKHRELFGQTGQDRFPLLTKIIDAKEKLSIQVHPDDIYAGAHENGSPGKTECWYVLDCPEDARLIVGHNARTRAELESMIREARWSELIREVPVRKGDFIQIDPGTVHAITAGMLILETQQNSDITYRVYDYDRLSDGKPRELHIGKSLDVIRVPAKTVEDSIFSTQGLPVNRLNQLYGGQYYRIFKAQVQGEMTFAQAYPFLSVSVCEGKGYIDGIPLVKGEHFIIPAGYGAVRLEGEMLLIVSSV